MVRPATAFRARMVRFDCTCLHCVSKRDVISVIMHVSQSCLDEATSIFLMKWSCFFASWNLSHYYASEAAVLLCLR